MPASATELRGGHLSLSRPLKATAGRSSSGSENVKPGNYAIAVFHDLNGNGKLDRNLIGLPSEPYGFSNDVGRRGFPSF